MPYYAFSPGEIESVMENEKDERIAGGSGALGEKISGIPKSRFPRHSHLLADNSGVETQPPEEPERIPEEDEVREVAGIFRTLAEKEDQLSSKAQGLLEGIGRGPATELL